MEKPWFLCMLGLFYIIIFSLYIWFCQVFILKKSNFMYNFRKSRFLRMVFNHLLTDRLDDWSLVWQCWFRRTLQAQNIGSKIYTSWRILNHIFASNLIHLLKLQNSWITANIRGRNNSRLPAKTDWRDRLAG